MLQINEMNKEQLRQACRAAGISYGKLNNDGMREALNAKQLADAAQALHDGLPTEEPKLKVADPSTMKYAELVQCACPHCGIGLDNGLLNRDDEAANKRGVTLYMEGMNHEWQCMGCGGMFGEEIAPFQRNGMTAIVDAMNGTNKPRDTGKAQTSVKRTGNGLKIEKDREERNGVKRPSIGGACRAVWDALDAMVSSGKPATAKNIKEWAEAQGMNPNNASIEFYQWRKFNGIRGRQ